MSRRERERRNRSRSRSPQWEPRHSSSRHRSDDKDELTVSDKVTMLEEELDILEGNLERERSRASCYCDTCDVHASGIIGLQKHFAGAKHRKNLAKRGFTDNFDQLVKPPSDERVSNAIVKCVLCSVILQGSEIDVHTNSEKHTEMVSKVKVEEAEADSKNGIETQWYVPVVTCEETKPDDESITKTNGPFLCELCSLEVLTKDNLDLHLNGKKHQKKLRWKHIIEGNGNSQAQYWCSICSIFCTQRQALDQHFAGKQHAKMLRSKGVSEDEISLGLESNTKALEDVVLPEIKLEESRFDWLQSSKMRRSQSPIAPLNLPPVTTPSLSSCSTVATSNSPANTSFSERSQYSYSKGQENSHQQDSMDECDKKPSVGSVVKQHNLLSVGLFLQSIQPSYDSVNIKSEPKDNYDEVSSRSWL